MATWYEANRWSWGEPIRPVEVGKVTEKFLYLRKPSGDYVRRGKDTQWQKYFETFDEAADYLAKGHEKAIASAKNELNRAREAQKKFHDWLEAQNNSAT